MEKKALKNNRFLPLLGILLVAGCNTLPSATLRSVTLQIQPQIQDGGYATHALVTPYSASSINHLLVQLFTVDGSGEHNASLSLDIPGNQLTRTMSIGSLAHHTTYRLKAFAYKATGSADVDLISNTATMDVAVTDDDHPQVATFPIQLIDRPFTEQATTTLTVNPGGYASSGSISVTPVATP